MAFASWWYATHGDKKAATETKPTDKKTPESAEKKQGSASASATASAPSTAASAASSKVPASQERTMKPADPKAKPAPAPKPEPPKSTQTTKPKTTTTTSSSSTSSSTAAKPSPGKGPTKQDSKKADAGKPKDAVSSVAGKAAATTVASSSKPKGEVSSSVAGKAAIATVGAAAVGAAAVGAATVASSSKPKDEVKEEKKVSVDKISAATTPSKEKDDALDLLIDSLGGPESVPESPKFTGPEIVDTPATSEYLEELGKRESSIPPEYRHLLDGKGEKPTEPPPKAAEEALGDDDLIAAMSSEFVSSPTPPEEKKPKLEEKKEAQKASTAPTASSQPQSIDLSDEALDALLGTLEGPPVNVPESPQYTGPEVTENITSTYLEELGKRDSSIPPEYRHLLDGKDHSKPLPPFPAAKLEPALTDMDVLDELSKDFEFSPPSPAKPSAPPAPAAAPKDTKQDKQAKADVVVPSSASSVQAATATSAGMDTALDELMGTLEGPEFNVPESPAYTGPEVTETSTATHIEELGKRESSIPPAYRHLLDGKAGEKPAAPPPEEKPMTESELADELDFTCSPSPVVQKTPPAKPKDTELKKAEPESVVSATSSSSVQATLSKAPTCKADPLDALSGTLGVRKEDPKDKKTAADSVKEQTGKDKKDKLGEDEKTIPPDYRLKEVKDKDGKPLLPKPEEKPQAMSEDDLLDALDEGFVTSPAASQCPPLKSSEKPSQKSGSEEIVSCSKVSSVHSSAPKPPSVSIPDDALDLLSGSLGTRIEDPDEKKPVVDLVKEKAKKEHIDRLGDRDDTIPPEYRHILDGKDQGKPAKPEEVKPKASLSDDAAIDALSGGFSLCDTGSADKAKSSSKDKTEKSASSTPVSQTAGKTPEATKDKTGTCTSSTPVSKTAEKTPDAPKPTSQSSSTTPSASKTTRS
ncbi:calpastatin isoform X2 [Rana temporaria]|uniref:calpastatin isoform X2 n=1 Tax=Rana temporaria TaxID=8407 RepID=UPI001AADCF4A|nr:calpastatin isoform X2 [Rana temporaria]